MIVYNDPVPPVGSINPPNRKLQPVTYVFTVADPELVSDNPDAHTLSGGVRGADDAAARARRLFGSTVAGGSVRLLPAERFRDFWSRLESAGLFKNPRHTDSEPPGDTSYFLLRSGKDEWIFARPPEEQPRPGTPEFEHRRHWVAAKYVLIDFLNQP